MQYIPNESLTLIKNNKTKKKKFNIDILFVFASEAYSSIYPSTIFLNVETSVQPTDQSYMH